MAEDVDESGIRRLLDIMARLRDREKGCPWDIEQNFTTIAPYTIEEAYEVAQAIAENDKSALLDELGDLLFQVVYHAQMAAEDGDFTFDDVVAAISDKMVRRHPHVFGDADVADAEEQTRAWEEHKAAERAEKAADQDRHSVLDGVPLNLPALLRAYKLQRRAARVGFDWNDRDAVLAKVDEELAELREALESGNTDGNEAVREELGDLLFVIVNTARHLDVDPETALRDANRKFERRFKAIESILDSEKKDINDQSLEELDALWDRVKAAQRGKS